MMHYDVDVLEDYLRGELAPEHDAAVHAHLDGCAACRALHDEAASLRDWIRTAAKLEEQAFPDELRARVWAEIRTPRPSPLQRLWAVRRPLFALPAAAVAAAAAIALAFGVGALHEPAASGATRVAATYYLEEHAAQSAGNPLADRSTMVIMSSLERSTGAPGE